MGLGFNHQLVMERCRQISETNTIDERMRKSRKIPKKNANGEDSSVKGHSRKHFIAILTDAGNASTSKIVSFSKTKIPGPSFDIVECPTYLDQPGHGPGPELNNKKLLELTQSLSMI